MRVTLDVPPHLSPESTPTNCESLRPVAKVVNAGAERFSLDRKEKRSTAKAHENEWTRLPLRQIMPRSPIARSATFGARFWAAGQVSALAAVRLWAPLACVDEAGVYGGGAAFAGDVVPLVAQIFDLMIAE